MLLSKYRRVDTRPRCLRGWCFGFRQRAGCGNEVVWFSDGLREEIRGANNSNAGVLCPLRLGAMTVKTRRRQPRRTRLCAVCYRARTIGSSSAERRNNEGRYQSEVWSPSIEVIKKQVPGEQAKVTGESRRANVSSKSWGWGLGENRYH